LKAEGDDCVEPTCDYNKGQIWDAPNNECVCDYYLYEIKEDMGGFCDLREPFLMI